MDEPERQPQRLIEVLGPLLDPAGLEPWVKAYIEDYQRRYDVMYENSMVIRATELVASAAAMVANAAAIAIEQSLSSSEDSYGVVLALRLKAVQGELAATEAEIQLLRDEVGG